MHRMYANPVYQGYLADPFVWRHADRYYVVGTGQEEAVGTAKGPRVIPLLCSTDLVDWHVLHHALLRPSGVPGNEFWAPAVAAHGGLFYMYYSVGQCDANIPHHVRVAVATRPEGPYEDGGMLVADTDDTDAGHDPFLYDPHPFRDDDGQWYLFYNRQFWDGEGDTRPGEAIVVRRLETMTSTGRECTTVLRGHADWHRRPSFTKDGQVHDWHTVEGACVVKHAGRYYCFYSGAAWWTPEYGVDFATSDHVLGSYQTAPSVMGPRLLASIPGHVRGPGHNSLVLGPDGQTWYIVYHAWNRAMSKRQMCIDPVRWTQDGPVCDGPSWEPRTVIVAPEMHSPAPSPREVR